MSQQEGSFGPQPISKKVIHFRDYLKYGCPVCLTGETKTRHLLSTAGCTLAACAGCGAAYLVCHDLLVTVPDRLSDYAGMVIPKHPAMEGTSE